MKKKPTGIESLAVMRAKVADSDKVRYRVYRDATDFIAVIAESALMAMKVSGIAVPYRIVRDLPSTGIAIEAQKMASRNTDEQVSLPTEQSKKPGKSFLNAEIDDKTVPLDAQFVPIGMGDLKKKSIPWARVLTPEMVSDIRQSQPEAPAPKPAPAAAPAAAPVPTPQAAPAMDEVEIEPSPQTAPPPEDAEPLSEEEVQKLLNS
jgi:hypothetical protein